MTTVFIDGSAGTTGLRIKDRLSGRTDISLLTLTDEQRKNPAARKEALMSADISFLCLPDPAAIEAVELAKTAPRAMVIGGGSIYRQMMPFCDTAYITKVHVTPESDTYFPNLDADDDWYLAETLQSGEENGIAYEMLLYKRRES